MRSGRRRQKDAVEDGAAVADWGSLPATAVSQIARLLAGADTFRWCAVCRGFRDVQPPLRALFIGDHSYDYDIDRWRNAASSDGVAVEIISGAAGRAHRVVESLSARHAGELTHLYLDAVHTWDYEAGAPHRLVSAATPLAQYGTHLRALQTLVVYHPAAGSTIGFIDGDPSLGGCLEQLIRATAPTLRALHLALSLCCSPELLERVVKLVGPQLHYLNLSCTPWSFGINRPAGEAADTIRIRGLVAERCRRLQGANPPT